ncbi:MAG: hypothetical protein JXA82_05440 [Sedimentisphaerales bacterium]|nr:hypothetical protein [Sedimentisphaerales bacterium]
MRNGMVTDTQCRTDSSDLASQLLSQVAEFLPEDGPILVVRGPEGDYSISDHDRLEPSFCQEVLEDLHDRIGDGWEPATIQAENYFIIGLQVYAEPGYNISVFLVLPGYSGETVRANTDLIETLIGQIHAIGNLLVRIRQMERFLQFREYLGVKKVK